MAFSSPDVFLNSVDLAKELGLRLKTISEYVRRNLLIPHTRVGRNYVFTRAECDRFKRMRHGPGNPNFVKSAADVPAPATKRRKTKAKAAKA